MQKYDKNNTNDLKVFLYNSYAHDAKIESVQYDYRQDRIKIELYNPIFDVKIDLFFLNIVVALKTKGDWSSNYETIYSLTLEEDFSYLQNFFLTHREYMEDTLYLLFTMFSGDELHILAKEVIVEVKRNMQTD